MNPRLRALIPVLLDLIVPLGGYFLLHFAFGLNAFWSLTLSGAATAAVAITGTIRRRKLDTLGLLVVLELALSAAFVFVTDDPRIVLIKPAFYVGAAAVFALFSAFSRRPLVMDSGKPFATKGDPELADAYERAWVESPKFRRRIRSVTVFWAGAFAVDAVLRVIVVYSLPASEVDKSVWLSQVPLLAVFAAAIVFTRLRMRPMRELVESYRLARA